jgi:transketolase
MAEPTTPNYRKSVIDLLMPFARADERIVLLVGDMGFGAIERFAREFPGRFYNSGIAEQGMVGIAAGMALGGLKPIVYHMPNFLAFRAIEQVRNDVVMQDLPVKFIATGVDDYFKFLGKSHCCGQQDAEIMKMVGMRVHDPYRDGLPFDELVSRWVGDESPAYLRV